MTYALFLVADLDVTAGDPLTLTGKEAHHAGVVKRVEPRERIFISDGRGARVVAEVISVSKNAVETRVVDVMETENPHPRFTLIQGLPKRERHDLTVELATELGFHRIIAWQADRSVTRWVGEKIGKSVDKWQMTAREATKQSRRAIIPQVEFATTDQLERFLDQGVIVADEMASESIAQVGFDDVGDQIAIVIGPEGGFSERERELFAKKACRSVLISDAILRTSTAGGVALALVKQRLAGLAK